MKRVTWVVLLIGGFSHAAFANEIDLQIIKQLESGGNRWAFNKHSQARGLYQISRIARRDYVQRTGDFVSELDLHIPARSRQIAIWMLRKRLPEILKANGKKICKENILIAWHAGHTKVGRKIPRSTRAFIAQYNKLEKRR